MLNNSSGIILLLLIIFVASPVAIAQDHREPKKANERPSVIEPLLQTEPFDAFGIDQMASRCALLETEKGEIRFEFFPEEAPATVRNFLNLASIGAFDTTTFSRVVKDFVVQGGNISTRADSSPDLRRRAARRVPDEPNRISHLRGIVSLARPDEPNSATSHFFVLVSDSTFLDGKFTAFARVISGMDVIDEMNRMDVDGEKPVNPVRVSKVSIYQCQTND
jgi:cyclophilin family peptidyl-prolyl cis-trans isomerase